MFTQIRPGRRGRCLLTTVVAKGTRWLCAKHGVFFDGTRGQGERVVKDFASYRCSPLAQVLCREECEVNECVSCLPSYYVGQQAIDLRTYLRKAGSAVKGFDKAKGAGGIKLNGLIERRGAATKKCMTGV